MFKILKKEYLANNIWLMDIEAPKVAKSCKPGQFVIVKMDEEGERIPLTICDYNKEKGIVTIVFQIVGASTLEMADYEEGQSFMDFVGPLGCASELVGMPIEELKKESILFVCGGVGTAPVYPQAKWMKEHGIDVDVIIGARTKDIIILEEEMRKVAANLYVATEDGSYGFKGNGCDQINELVKNQGRKYTRVVAIGPMIMMKFEPFLVGAVDVIVAHRH